MKQAWGLVSLILVLTITTPPAQASEARPIVAVFDVEKDRRIKLPRASLVEMANYLATRLTESGVYQVIPRDQLKKRLFAQKKKSYKECYDQNCQIEVGRELAAEKTLSTRIGKIGKRCTVTLTLYDLKKATTESAASQHGPCGEDEILTSLDKALGKLFGASKSFLEDQAKQNAEQKRLAQKADEARRNAEKERLAKEAEKTRIADEKERERARLKEEAQKKKEIAEFHGRCDAGEMQACADLGEKYQKGQGLLMNHSKASDLFQKACVLGNMTGCFSLGQNYWRGQGVGKDLHKASQLFRKACDGGNMPGCIAMGSCYQVGKGVDQDDKKANQLFRKACDGGYMPGCTSLGYSHYSGLGVSKDFELAVPLFRKACDGKELTGCYYLADCYKTGKGITKDPKKANQIFINACDKGYSPACSLAEY